MPEMTIGIITENSKYYELFERISEKLQLSKQIDKLATAIEGYFYSRDRGVLDIKHLCSTIFISPDSEERKRRREDVQGFIKECKNIFKTEWEVFLESVVLTHIMAYEKINPKIKEDIKNKLNL